MIGNDEILEIINMISKYNLDIRTVTMGISLLDCIDSDIDVSCQKVYKKIHKYAKNLVKVCDEVANKYGIPIVNKRISITPISMLVGANNGNPIKYALILDKIAEELQIDFIGGYSALVQSGFTKADKTVIKSIPEALAKTSRLCASVVVGSSKDGINLDAIKMCSEVIKNAAILTKDNDCIGASKFVAICNPVENNPFMAGSFHGVSMPDVCINVGISGPGVIRNALSKLPKDANIIKVSEEIKRNSFKITRIAQLIGSTVSEKLNLPFGIIDLSLAPTPAKGDSIANILEEMGLDQVGCPGTTACLALLNDAVKKGGIMAAENVGGLSGAFIPVSEDQGMIDSVKNNCITIEKLEAMTCVCSVGLDMIAIPGDTSNDTIAGIIADESAIGMINNKTTAVRIIPVIGKGVGEEVNFGGLLGYAPIIKVNNVSPSVFVNRGGHIPAPIHSFKN